MTAPKGRPQPKGTVSLDELVAEKLSQRVIDAIEKVEVKKTFDIHMVIEGGVLTIAGEAKITVTKLIAFISTIAAILVATLYYIFPNLQPLLDAISSLPK